MIIKLLYQIILLYKSNINKAKIKYWNFYEHAEDQKNLNKKKNNNIHEDIIDSIH